MEKIAKGKLVRINEVFCFTKENGGKREYPFSNWDRDERRVVCASYDLTKKEQTTWREEERRAIKAGEILWCDDAGEPRLCPRQGSVELKAGTLYPVIRARMRAHIGYHVYPGYMKVLDTESGLEVMVDRKCMELAQ